MEQEQFKFSIGQIVRITSTTAPREYRGDTGVIEQTRLALDKYPDYLVRFPNGNGIWQFETQIEEA